ncbi:hypothetical protein RG47T_2825 [Mucilaginibacter polytrichastri]|uniref:Uncharacterized protein n=1 Tax=Mucilaginibacter polytrichastri TaxID=1302689 RepID=A0A1Q6A012_9SPHI|nr:hypothetical protein RG47T_2825 [Mucilaginibacter polytrichastri]
MAQQVFAEIAGILPEEIRCPINISMHLARQLYKIKTLLALIK